MAFGLTAYVSRCRLPFTAQGSLPAAGQALPDGLSPAGFLRKVFNSLHARCPPFPSFLAQSPEPPELRRLLDARSGAAKTARHRACGRSVAGVKKVWPVKAPGVDCAAAFGPLALVLHVAKLVKDKVESDRPGRSSLSCGR
jgi:hypothetical protein